MFNSVVFNVVVGLIFIYLLYSLLGTVLAEIIATKISLRARNLKEAISRMLNDEPELSWFQRFWDSLMLMKNPKNPNVEKFYANPEIKYLGSSGLFKNPSSIKAESFSKTLLYILNGGGTISKVKIERSLKSNAQRVLGNQSIAYILSLYEESQGDLVKFKLQLENWFDRTMEQATEWYKRKIQMVLFALGFLLAWFFNADTVKIVNTLSKDTDARDKLVNLAAAYMQSNPVRPPSLTLDSVSLSNYNQKLDSLLAIKEKLNDDMAEANTIMGLGSWLPDTVVVTINKSGAAAFPRFIDKRILPRGTKIQQPNGYALAFSMADKLSYFFKLPVLHFYGFLLTAFAISLGAPFWFDLLNKLMRLRTAVKHEPAPALTANDKDISPLMREG